jgi:hypothetical protein
MGSTVIIAVPSLLIAVGGVGLALLGLRVDWWVPIAFAIVLAAAGYSCSALGKSQLPGKPKTGMLLMQLRFLAPLAWSALAAAAAIWVAIQFEPPEDLKPSIETKQLLSAGAGALTAFLTTAFIKSGEEADEKWIAARVKSAFEEKYQGYFMPGSPGQLAVFSPGWDGGGWGWPVRYERAKAIADALATDKMKNEGEPPPSPK